MTKLSPVETARIITQVARGVARAHGLGVIHRDLKPQVRAARAHDPGFALRAARSIQDYLPATRSPSSGEHCAGQMRADRRYSSAPYGDRPSRRNRTELAAFGVKPRESSEKRAHDFPPRQALRVNLLDRERGLT